MSAHFANVLLISVTLLLHTDGRPMLGLDSMSRLKRYNDQNVSSG